MLISLKSIDDDVTFMQSLQGKESSLAVRFTWILCNNKISYIHKNFSPEILVHTYIQKTVTCTNVCELAELQAQAVTGGTWQDKKSSSKIKYFQMTYMYISRVMPIKATGVW